MKYNIDISQAAEQDVRAIFLWYEDQKEGLGVDFEIDFSKAVNSILNNPLKTQIRYTEVRVFFMNKFPYGIHFTITDNTILIAAVFATKDNPEKWSKGKR